MGAGAQLIEGTRNAIENGSEEVPSFFRYLIGEWAAEAGEGAVIAGDVAEAAALSISGAVLGLIVAVPVLAILVTDKFLGDKVDEIPWIGGKLHSALDWATNQITDFLEPLIDPFVSLIMMVIVGAIHFVQRVTAPSFQEIANVDYYQQAEIDEMRSQTIPDLENTVSNLEAQNNDLYNALRQLQHAIDNDLYGLNVRMGNVEARTGSLESGLSRFADASEARFSADEGTIQRLQYDLETDVRVREAEHVELQRGLILTQEQLATVTAQQSTDDHTLYNPTDGLTSLIPLLGIATLAAPLIKNLIDDAIDPCRCMGTGGSYGWVAPVVADLVTQNGL